MGTSPDHPGTTEPGARAENPQCLSWSLRGEGLGTGGRVEGKERTPGGGFKRLGREGRKEGVTDLGSLSVQSLVLTVCVSQSQAKARAIQGLRKQLVWVSVRWAGRGHPDRERATIREVGSQAGNISGEGGGGPG